MIHREGTQLVDGKGESVRLSGVNLGGATTVKFNGLKTIYFTVNSATQITATVPANASAGPI